MIRAEAPADLSAIHAVNCSAFGQEAEALLVDQLRRESRIFKSLVAVEEGRIVGNIVFSDLRLETDVGAMKALALAPVAVLPKFQRRLIGTQLVNAGLEQCRHSANVAVLVLGDPAFYSRFGFSSELGKRIRSPYSGVGAAWMALELREGALRNVSATVTYPEAFKVVD